MNPLRVDLLARLAGVNCKTCGNPVPPDSRYHNFCNPTCAGASPRWQQSRAASEYRHARSIQRRARRAAAR